MNVYRATEELLECPLDPVHRIIPHRMAKHLINCKKNYPDKVRKMKECPFNGVHLVMKEDFQAHLMNCPDNKEVERDLFVYVKEDEQPLINRNEELDSRVMVNQWNDDETTNSYRPLDSIIYKEIIRPPPIGLGKAGKKEWYAKENLRLERLKKGLPIDDITFPSAEGYESMASSFAEVHEKMKEKANVVKVKPTEPFHPWVKLNKETKLPENNEKKAKEVKNNPMVAYPPLRRPKNSRIAANIFNNPPQPMSIINLKKGFVGYDPTDTATDTPSGFNVDRKISIGRGSFLANLESLKLN